MSQKKKYLTKSKYVLAAECPTKLYYASHPEIYDNIKTNDPFMQALADGGFQVGELAKLFHRGGVEVTTSDHDEAVRETAKLLGQQKVTIYEAAFCYGSFFVRADIVVKNGSTVKIYEVKAKSFKPDKDNFFHKTLEKKGIYQLNGKWERYFYDIAFQTYVARLAYPDLTFEPHLTLVDKSKKTTVAGLNQKFALEKDHSRKRVSVQGDTTPAAMGAPILTDFAISRYVDIILEGRDKGEQSRREQGLPSFAEEAGEYANILANDQKQAPSISAKCKKCEFRARPASALKDGRKECWKTAAQLSDEDLQKPLVIDLWSYRKTDTCISDNKFLLSSLSRDDVGDGPEGQRQWIQIEHTRKNEPYINTASLGREMAGWDFPLNFVDFETARVAIPFFKDSRPYEQVAFQFSLHTVQKDGTVAHVEQFLHEGKGECPNFHFIKALKAALEKNNGTIFCYGSHENTALVDIYRQLEKSSEPNRTELMDWIKTVTSKKDEWQGERSMVDMLRLVQNYYFHPSMKGSNSLKDVLPAMLSSSTFLQKKYGSATYGSKIGIPSLNFKDHCWVNMTPDGSVIDPYKTLAPIFKDLATDGLDLASEEEDEELNDGGAAMMAFTRMQYTKMSNEEREAIKAALLRYCELDTLAMVMVYEAWVDFVAASAPEKKRA